VSGTWQTIFRKFYTLQEKLSCTPKKNSGSRNVEDTYSEQKRTTQIFTALTLASTKREVGEARSFVVEESKKIFKTEQISTVISYYSNDSMQKKFSGVGKQKLKKRIHLFLIPNTLDKCRIDEDNCFAQTHNGANVKTGLAME